MMLVDIRSIDVPKQEVITKDNVTAGVDAVVYAQRAKSRATKPRTIFTRSPLLPKAAHAEAAHENEPRLAVPSCRR